MAASLASPRPEDSLSLSYFEVTDPLGTSIDKSVSKILDECTSKIDIKTYTVVLLIFASTNLCEDF